MDDNVLRCAATNLIPIGIQFTVSVQNAAPKLNLVKFEHLLPPSGRRLPLFFNFSAQSIKAWLSMPSDLTTYRSIIRFTTEARRSRSSLQHLPRL